MIYEKSLETYERLYIKAIANGNIERAKQILEEIERLEEMIRKLR